MPHAFSHATFTPMHSPAPLQSIIKSFRMAAELAVQRVKDFAVSLEDKDLEEKKDLLKKCAMTTLNSKLVSDTYF